MGRKVAIVSLAWVVPDDFPEDGELSDTLRALADLWDETPPAPSIGRVPEEVAKKADLGTGPLWRALGHTLKGGGQLGFALRGIHPDDDLRGLGFEN